MTAIIAAAIGWAGAFAQARGGRAQAAAAKKAAQIQADAASDAAQLQFIQSSRVNACAGLVAEVLEFETLLTQFNKGVGPGVNASFPVFWSGGADAGSAMRRWAARRERQDYPRLVESVAKVRRACAVIELHGPEGLREAALELLAECEENLSHAHEAVRSVAAEGWVPSHVVQVRAARRRFADVARPYLGSSGTP
ncbi:hypothetical protein [Streptomyces sp. NPDC058308]|uniref:hypothetical protein n=1 Tax=Streptomyces sp. NPDC058308 TaxID=3346440 RepID=UPI0036EDE069